LVCPSKLTALRHCPIVFLGIFLELTPYSGIFSV
jgi:hypothetical protein